MSTKLFPTYRHVAPPPGHPRPWRYQAMYYLWWRIAMDMVYSDGKRVVVQARVHTEDFPGVVASGGAYKSVPACHHHPSGCPKSGCWMK